MEESRKVEIQGVLLHLPASYWAEFINKDGTLSEAKLVKAGYDGEGQVEWIRGEMTERGWLQVGGDEPKKTTGKKGK